MAMDWQICPSRFGMLMLKWLFVEVRRLVRIALVPSAASPGNGDSGFFLTSYIIDDVVAIDAGGLGLLGDLNAQFLVRDVFLSHSHMDHVASLPIFLDTVYRESGKCVTLHASEVTLDTLRRDVFNGRLWADFVGMSSPASPIVALNVLRPGHSVEVAGLRLTPIEVDHVIPTLGFLIDARGVTVAISSDTGPTDAFWQAAHEAKDLRAVFLEASFPDEMSDLALISKHLTPAMFAGEFRKLQRHVPVIAMHIKPRFYDQVVAQLRTLGLPDLRIGQPGETYEFTKAP
jgi:ribonuclease BN (tRNA processing enzyme)